MKTAQRKAVEQYRSRQKSKGFVRMEVSIPEQDRELIRIVAANLRAGGQVAENTRQLLMNVQNPYLGMDFKEFLEAAPLEDVEFERPVETTRDIDL